MFAPSEEKNHCSSRRKFILVSASVTPATDRNSESIFSNSSAAYLAVLGGESAAALVHNAGISVAGPAKRSNVQSPFSDFFHSEIQIYHRERGRFSFAYLRDHCGLFRHPSRHFARRATRFILLP